MPMHLAAIVAGALVLGLVACGDDESTTTGSSTPSITALKVSGGGSAQFREKGGDNSVQEFGEEADEAELTEAAEALHAYLVARAKKDWGSVCSYLSRSLVREMEKLAARSTLKDKSCAAIVGALVGGAKGSEGSALTVVDAASLRTEGNQSFLLYHGAKKTDLFVSMTKEGDVWKVASLELNTFS
jgi:hypothetical protein